MDQENLEEGELSDENCEEYTPLERPELTLHEKVSAGRNFVQEQQQQLNDVNLEDSQSDCGPSSGSSSYDSDDVINAVNSKSDGKQKLKKHRIIPYAKTVAESESKQSNNKLKKYNIWTATLQEESLLENMRDIDVNRYPTKQDRNVESYNFSLASKLQGDDGGGGCFKRRHSDDDDNNETAYSTHRSKRFREVVPTFTGKDESGDWKSLKKSIKHRLGQRQRKNSTKSCNSDNQNAVASRYILDLTVNLENDTNAEIARDIANKLYEEKDELMLRVVEVLGKEIPISIFKETQNIEKNGGMMTMNGCRRRTPGGVFLFLLKHHDKITAQDKKRIFDDDVKTTSRQRKKLSARKRNRKAEELKKQLRKEKKEFLPELPKHIDMEIMSHDHLKSDSDTPHTNSAAAPVQRVLNPPPSPATNSDDLENSPIINVHVNDTDGSPEEKSSSTNRTSLEAVNDDEFIDINYTDMDLF